MKDKIEQWNDQDFEIFLNWIGSYKIKSTLWYSLTNLETAIMKMNNFHLPEFVLWRKPTTHAETVVCRQLSNMTLLRLSTFFGIFNYFD